MPTNYCRWDLYLIRRYRQQIMIYAYLRDTHVDT